MTPAVSYLHCSFEIPSNPPVGFKYQEFHLLALEWKTQWIIVSVHVQVHLHVATHM